jgi:1,4-dihydroxy-6-naphthoate synthase
MATTSTAAVARTTLRIGHSPDPDDAFMWYPLANRTSPDGTQLRPKIDTGRYDFVHVLEDIQSLNERSERAELEITALSIAQYPFVADRYVLTSCGASMGEGYGPMVVARADHALTIDDLADAKVAVPGERTSAFLALSLRMGRRVPRYDVVMFDRIIEKVVSGEYDAGLIIHEGQLTYGEAGLRCVEDLGRWWTDTRGLPLPLGGNAIRRDLGAKNLPEICGILLESIRYALSHRDEAVSYALHYARDMGRDLADEFVGMYVNEQTLDYGDRGRRAVREFLREAHAMGLIPDPGDIDFVTPA